MRLRMVDWEEVWEHECDQRKGGPAPRVGMSYGEVAEALGTSKGRVRIIEQRALAKLRGKMEDWR